MRIPPSTALYEEPGSGGARLAFRTLYREYFAFTWRTLRFLGVSERNLEDCAQDLWVVVHRRYDTFEGRSNIKSWLFGIAVNIERNLRRVEGRRTKLVALPDELIAVSGDPALEREGREAWELVQGFLATLDEARRAVFVAALLEGLSAAETAEATGLARTDVYNRIRALRRSFDVWAQKHRREP